MRPLLVLALASLTSTGCSRHSAQPAAAPAAPAAVVPTALVQTGGAVRIGMPAEPGNDAAPSETVITLGSVFAAVSGGQLTLVLVNSDASNVTCHVLMTTGPGNVGNGWSLTFSAPFNGRAGATGSGTLSINHPRDGAVWTNILDGSVQVSSLTPGSVVGEIDVHNERGDRYVRGHFIARVCSGRDML